MAVVIGSEGRGVRPQVLEEADQALIIPMNPKCESLNAAVAATIAMWLVQGNYVFVLSVCHQLIICLVYNVRSISVWSVFSKVGIFIHIGIHCLNTFILVLLIKGIN